MGRAGLAPISGSVAVVCGLSTAILRILYPQTRKNAMHKASSLPQFCSIGRTRRTLAGSKIFWYNVLVTARLSQRREQSWWKTDARANGSVPWKRVKTKFEWLNRPCAFVPQLYSWLGTSRRRRLAALARWVASRKASAVHQRVTPPKSLDTLKMVNRQRICFFVCKKSSHTLVWFTIPKY